MVESTLDLWQMVTLLGVVLPARARSSLRASATSNALRPMREEAASLIWRTARATLPCGVSESDSSLMYRHSVFSRIVTMSIGFCTAAPGSGGPDTGRMLAYRPSSLRSRTIGLE